MVLLLSVYKSSLGKACFYFICDILLRAWASRGGGEGELDSLEATVDVWHWESEVTRRKKKNPLSVSLWPWIIWNGSRRQGRFVILVVQWQEFGWRSPKHLPSLPYVKQVFLLGIDAHFCMIIFFYVNMHLDMKAYTCLEVSFYNFQLLGKKMKTIE